MTLHYRALPFQVRGVDKKTREVDFIIATENPADMGWGAPEVLLMDGLDTVPERGVPLLNAHSRWDVRNVLGRVVSIQREGAQLSAKYRFSDATQEARDAFALVEDGSIDAASIGYQVTEVRDVDEGEVYESGESRVEGPAVVVTKWALKESSLVPIGADAEALKRALTSGSDDEMKPRKKTKKKTRAKADDEDEDEEEKADDEEEEGDETKPDEDEDEEEKADDEDEDEEKSLDLADAKHREARRRQILSFTPTDLRSFAEDLLLKDPSITPEAARKALLEERAKRLGNVVGTPEPKPAGKAISKPPAAKDDPEGEEDGTAVLCKLIREVH